MRLTANHTPERLVRFVLLGLSNVVVGYGIFFAFYWMHVFPDYADVALSQTLSYGFGSVWAFYWSRNWTFREPNGQTGALGGQLIRFLLIQVMCLLLSVVLVSFAIEGLKLAPLPGWLSAMALVTVIHYFALASWAFPSAKRSQES